MFFDELYETCKKRAKHTIWVFSDLQQAKYENARSCLDICLDDYERLSRPAEQIWYLGDGVEGNNLNELERMANMQNDEFTKLGIPLCYVTGNHDYDYAYKMHHEGSSIIRMPFYEIVQNHPGWHTTKSMEDTWFTLPVDEDWQVFFFSEHIAKDLSWLSTHNQVSFGHDVYPYGEEHWAEIRNTMANCGKRVITAAHCAFPGGNRDTELLGRIQPLPTNVRLHIYGHSHIGEYAWPKERVFCKISWTDWQDVPQVDVASFENIRGAYCRSAILHIYDDNSLGIFFRNHDKHMFTDAFFPALDSQEDRNDGQPGKPWEF